MVDDYRVSNLSDRGKPTRLVYTYRLMDYFQNIDDEIYLNLNLNKQYYNTFINTDTRTAPRENEYKYIQSESISLQIPKGYEVEYLPANTTIASPMIGCDIRYRVEGDKILYSKKFYLDDLMLTPDEFRVWNESVKQISEAYKESIILKNISR
jgi:hypothetical protein